MDAYNANPTSMAASLNSFGKINDPSKAVILGDMFELGEASVEEHQKIVELIKSMDFSLVLLAGAQFSKCKCPDNFLIFGDNGSLKEYLGNKTVKGHFILIKGSRGMKLESLLELL